MKEFEIKAMYEKEMHSCQKCKKIGDERFPLQPTGMWYCGENAKDGIMFVGKTAITEKDESYKTMTFEKGKELLDHPNRSSFFGYINCISENSEEIIDKICITNFVKCNKGSVSDESTKKMMNNCYKFLLDEIKIVQPKNIIFMLNLNYKEVVKEMFKEYVKEEQNDIDTKVKMTVIKYMPVWSFKVDIYGGVDCLFIGHPQGLKKNKYVEIVKTFINNKEKFKKMMCDKTFIENEEYYDKRSWMITCICDNMYNERLIRNLRNKEHPRD